MMRRFLSNNVALLFLVVITTIDASRIFYLPLPKIHSSHQELKPSANTEELEKKSINNEFIPLSAMERNMYDEQEESENDIEWELLRGEQAGTKRLIMVNEVAPTNQRDLENQVEISNDERGAEIDTVSLSLENPGNSAAWNPDSADSILARLQSNDALNDSEQRKRRNDTLFLVIVGICSLVGIVGLVAAAIFWYKIQKRAETALDAEYPSYGVTGPGSSGSKISPSSTVSDRKLAQSAQMFHYQQQRQQMMAQEKAHLDAKPVHSDDSDDEAPNGGDYTVYECPGLAPTGEMEVRNPLFAEPDLSLTSSPSAPHPTTNNHYPQPSASVPSSSPPQEKLLS
jgi:hypothetical protein